MYNKLARLTGIFPVVLFVLLIFSNAKAEEQRLCLWLFENNDARIYLPGSIHGMTAPRSGNRPCSWNISTRTI